MARAIGQWIAALTLASVQPSWLTAERPAAGGRSLTWQICRLGLLRIPRSALPAEVEQAIQEAWPTTGGRLHSQRYVCGQVLYNCPVLVEVLAEACGSRSAVQLALHFGFSVSQCLFLSAFPALSVVAGLSLTPVAIAGARQAGGSMAPCAVWTYNCRHGHVGLGAVRLLDKELVLQLLRFRLPRHCAGQRRPPVDALGARGRRQGHVRDRFRDVGVPFCMLARASPLAAGSSAVSNSRNLQQRGKLGARQSVFLLLLPLRLCPQAQLGTRRRRPRGGPCEH